MSKMVPFQDGWGEEHKTRVPADAPVTKFAILYDDLPFYAEAVRSLSPKEWQVFSLYYVRKVTSTAEIAATLKLKQTGDVRKYLSRIGAKLSADNADLTLVEVRFPDQEDDERIPAADFLSRHQLTPPHSVTKEYKPVCRASAPSCRNRKDGMK